jgi:hypothetical protein
MEECWPCQVFASFTLEFALQLSKKHEKTSVKLAEDQDTHTLQNSHLHTPTHTHTLQNSHLHTHTHTHTLQNSLKPSEYKLKQAQYKIYPNELVTI